MCSQCLILGDGARQGFACLLSQTKIKLNLPEPLAAASLHPASPGLPHPQPTPCESHSGYNMSHTASQSCCLDQTQQACSDWLEKTLSPRSVKPQCSKCKSNHDMLTEQWQQNHCGCLTPVLLRAAGMLVMRRGSMRRVYRPCRAPQIRDHTVQEPLNLDERHSLRISTCK